MKKKLKLGTRKSLLAMTQSQWVANEIMKKNPEITIDLVGIETKGDLILDIPLSQIEGKEFFIKELDEALLENKVDFNVHSLKDLSLERPPQFFSGVHPKRALSNDILIFHKNAFEKIKKNKKIKIGTSAPRRLENTPVFLDQVFFSQHPFPKSIYEFIEIRGNINTRLSRLHFDDLHEKNLDAVILAAAGLNRVFESEKSIEELKILFHDVFFVVLPLSLCPPAPGQGALALECRQEDLETQKYILSIQDTKTSENIKKERATLQEYGGGCHQRFGASSTDHPVLGSLLIVKGASHKNEPIDRFEFPLPSFHQDVFKNIKIFDGSLWKSEVKKIPYSTAVLKDKNHVFITHARAVEGSMIPELQKKILWVSGMESWKKLTQRGLLIQGCLEGLGIHKFEEYIETSFLTLPPLKEWIILTNKEAEKSWPENRVITPYSSEFQVDDMLIHKAKNAQFFYWQSPEQYYSIESYIPESSYHFCGPGKTYDFLKQKNFPHLFAFPHSLLWKKWLIKNGVSL